MSGDVLNHGAGKHLGLSAFVNEGLNLGHVSLDGRARTVGILDVGEDVGNGLESGTDLASLQGSDQGLNIPGEGSSVLDAVFDVIADGRHQDSVDDTADNLDSVLKGNGECGNSGVSAVLETGDE